MQTRAQKHTDVLSRQACKGTVPGSEAAMLRPFMTIVQMQIRLGQGFD